MTYDYAQQTVALAKRERNAATSTIPDEYADETVFWENAVVVATIAGDLQLRESGRLPSCSSVPAGATRMPCANYFRATATGSCEWSITRPTRSHYAGTWRSRFCAALSSAIPSWLCGSSARPRRLLAQVAGNDSVRRRRFEDGLAGGQLVEGRAQLYRSVR
jgi:hypothetical protein